MSSHQSRQARRPLTGRIRELADRYATPLPKLTEEVEALAAKVVGHLNMKGLSASNLKYMRVFAEQSPNLQFVQHSTDQIPLIGQHSADQLGLGRGFSPGQPRTLPPVLFQVFAGADFRDGVADFRRHGRRGHAPRYVRDVVAEIGRSAGTERAMSKPRKAAARVDKHLRKMGASWK